MTSLFKKIKCEATKPKTKNEKDTYYCWRNRIVRDHHVFMGIGQIQRTRNPRRGNQTSLGAG